MGCTTSTASPGAQVRASRESDFRVCRACGALLPSEVTNCPNCDFRVCHASDVTNCPNCASLRSSAFALLYERAFGAPPVPAGESMEHPLRVEGPLEEGAPPQRAVMVPPVLVGSPLRVRQRCWEGRGTSALDQRRSSVLAVDGRLDGLVHNIALDDSNAALERLAALLDPDQQTLWKILSGLAAPGGDSRNWSCPDCTFRNSADAGSCETCERPWQGDEKIIIAVDDNAGVAQEENKEVAGKQTRDEPDDGNKDPAMDQALDEAIELISCPVCLEVYFSPLMLPCGHSLCLHHIPDMRTEACPVCRATFTQSQHRVAKNAALCRNVRTVVLLASLTNPDRETVRDARAMMRIEREELCSLGSALGLHVDASRSEEAADDLSERFPASP